MGKKRFKYAGIPFIRNSNMIGAGNQFIALRNEQGAIQWKLSVEKQQMQTPKVPAIKRKAEELISIKTLSEKRPVKMVARAMPRR